MNDNFENEIGRSRTKKDRNGKIPNPPIFTSSPISEQEIIYILNNGSYNLVKTFKTQKTL